MSALALPTWTGRSNRRRRLIQVGFLAFFVIVPLFDLFRFDFVNLRLHVLRRELWLDEWTLVWLGLMATMWVIGAFTLVLGRVFCAYACPQTVFIELARDAEAISRRLLNRLVRAERDPRSLAGAAGPRSNKVAAKMAPARRAQVERLLTYVLVGLLTLVAVVLFMGTFAPLPVVLSRLAHLSVGPWVGAVGAITTVLWFLNLVFVREKFCRTVCPYGLLQGVLEDGKSLHVAFDQTTGACVECGACVHVCPMEIDIREGAFQIECTRCGACVDACDKVLVRRKRPGLLGFRLGLDAGRWDLKRILVAASATFFTVAFVVAIVTRKPVALALSPLYADAATQVGTPEARFLLRVSNRGRETVTLAIRTEGLPAGASVDGLADGVVPAGEERRFTLVVKVPRDAARAVVTPFDWVVESRGRAERFRSTFYAGRVSS